MARKQHTTESLRNDLFGVIDDLREGKIDHETAGQIVKLSDQIIKTADLELKYAETVSKLDKDNQGITPGRMMLVDGSEPEGRG